MTPIPINDIDIEGNVTAWLSTVGDNVLIDGTLTVNQWREQQPSGFLAQTNGQIFVSYSRANAEFAHDLYIKLRALGFKVWRDRSEMEGGENWWQQIEQAISASETMVLCVSTEALASTWVEAEWRYARHEGTRVIPVFAGDVTVSTASPWMKKLDWLDFRENAPERDIIWAKFIKQLNTPQKWRPIPFNVPSLPARFEKRPDVFEKLLSHFLDITAQNPIAAISALQGSGGFGKTTMAIAFCHDDRVRDAFDDGMLWVEFGEKPDVLHLLNDQIKSLGGKGDEIVVSSAAAKLRNMLENKDVLIVLDDVWNYEHIRYFVQNSQKSRVSYLVTTRLQDVVTGIGAISSVVIDEMTLEQSVNLLAAGVGLITSDHTEFAVLAKRLGGWALLLELTNGVLRKHVSRYGLSRAMQRINEDLDVKGFFAFDQRNAEARNQALAINLDVSLNLFESAERERFYELAIFSEKMPVPTTTLELFWNLDKNETIGLCEAFADTSLAKFDGSSSSIRLHSVIRSIAEHRIGDVRPLHIRLIDKWGELTTLPDKYAWYNVAFHLRLAGLLSKLTLNLLDFTYLNNKLEATDVNALIADYDYFPDDSEIQLVKLALEASAHILAQNRKELPGQLIGRLLAHLYRSWSEYPYLEGLLESSLQCNNYSWLRPLWLTMQPAGTRLYRTLSGHHAQIRAVSAFSDGNRIVSGSDDGQIILWDIHAGVVLRRIDGHKSWIRCIAVVLEDRFVLSGSANGVLLSDINTGENIYSVAQNASVLSVAVYSNGCDALLGLMNGEVVLWDIEQGREKKKFFTNNRGEIWSIQLLDDQPCALFVSDRVIELWDIESSLLLRTFEHSQTVWGICLLSNNQQFVSVSQEQTMVLWNISTGESIKTFSLDGIPRAAVILDDQKRILVGLLGGLLGVINLETRVVEFTVKGHTSGLRTLLMLPDRRFVVSGGEDQKLRIWNTSLTVEWPDSESPILPRHNAWITAIAVLQDGRPVSASLDNDLRVWHERGGVIFSHHRMPVNDVASLGNTCFISASMDETLIIWDVNASQLLAQLKGHNEAVTGVIIEGGYILSSDAHTICLWDKNSKQLLEIWDLDKEELKASLGKYDWFVDKVTKLPNGYIIYVAPDHTVQIWDTERNPFFLVFGDVAGNSTNVDVLENRIVVSTENEITLRVWDGKTNETIRLMSGHTGRICGVTRFDDERVATASLDGSLRIWNVKTGICEAEFTTDDQLLCCAVAPQGIVYAGGMLGSVHAFQYRVEGVEYS